jgi:hypothetical protein
VYLPAEPAPTDPARLADKSTEKSLKSKKFLLHWYVMYARINIRICKAQFVQKRRKKK